MREDKRRYIDCDYVIDSSNNFFIVKGYHHPGDDLFACEVFVCDPSGERLNSNGLRYKKVIGNEILCISKETVVRHFKPREAKIRNNLSGVWKSIYNYLLEIGITFQDIGIFGSTLIGFPLIKDVDFVVYGIDNLKLLKNNMHKLKADLGFTDITKKHIRYQANDKYCKFHNPNTNSMKKTLMNKWSSIQIKDGLLTTIRFAFKQDEITDAFKFDHNDGNKEVCLEGSVIEDFYTNFCPRIFKVRNKDGTHTIKTYYWLYQACVKNGDRVLVRGRRMDDDSININNYNHGIIIKD